MSIEADGTERIEVGGIIERESTLVTDQTYFEGGNPDLLRIMTTLPPLTHPILEVGCGAGGLAKAFRAACPADRCGAAYVGVELNAQAAVVAASRLDEVIVGSIEDEAVIERVAARRYQLFVFGDVLEHLIDPWRTLDRLRTFATPDARLIACIPNVQHWSVIQGLLLGQWPYADSGLLDRTHLRFFTLESAVQMLRSTGWAPQNAVFRTLETQGKAFTEALRPALLGLGIDAERFEKQTMAFQYVIQATIAG